LRFIHAVFMGRYVVPISSESGPDDLGREEVIEDTEPTTIDKPVFVDQRKVPRFRVAA